MVVALISCDVLGLSRRPFPIVALLLAAACNRTPQPHPESAYIDPTTCSACHKEISEKYRRTGMGRSFAQPSTATAIEDWDKNNTFHHKPSDRYYTMFRKDGRLFQRRHQIGPNGQQTNIVEKEIHYIAGSGNHSRTYINQRPDGRLAELPVGWYAEGKGYWAMNPGFDRPDHDDFRRDINFQCMFCHNGYPTVAPGAGVSGTSPIFPRELPQGIDCQRCHGPGRAHVQAMQSGRSPTAIVNPARLSRERQLEVCLQCHLETTSFRLPGAILRYQREVFSYRPGEPLADYVLHFDHASRQDNFEIAHAGYRLRQSACFQKSAGAMVCTTCHDPHDAPRGEEAARRYSQACLRCHAPALEKLKAASRHTNEPDCRGCHMPRRRTDDVVHVAMTDHFIQRQKPARDLLAPRAEKIETATNAYKGEVIPYYPPSLPGPDGELYLAVAQVRQDANRKSGIPQLAAAIRKHQPREAGFYFELAEAHQREGSVSDAATMYEEALRRNPRFLPAIRGLAAVLGRNGRLAEASEVLRKALQSAPADPLLLNDLALVHAGQRQYREAAEALRKALEADPDSAEAHNNLAAVLTESGDRAAAESAFRNAIRLQPDMAEAHKNLANLLNTAGNFNDAQFHYQKAIASRQSYAAAHYDYGAALASHEQFPQARQQFEAAVKADPAMAEAHNALGEMFTILGDANHAMEAYRKAIAARPQFAAAHANLGSALLFQGKPADARQHLEQAVRFNPQAHEAHLHLGKALVALRDTTNAAQHFRKAAESPDAGVRREASEGLRITSP